MVDLFSVSTLSLEKLLELQPSWGWGQHGASRLLPKQGNWAGWDRLCTVFVQLFSPFTCNPPPSPRTASGGDSSSRVAVVNTGYLRRGCL